MATPTRAPRDTYVPGGESMRKAQEGVDLNIEPPVPSFDKETVFSPETDWEKWVLKAMYYKPQEVMPKFQQWVQTLPVFDGPEGNTDVLPPGGEPFDPPVHWLKTPIHFTPLADPHYTRVYYCSTGKYTFNNRENLLRLLGDLYGDQQPKRILDVGTGMGSSAFAFGELFPQAEVVGIDLAAHFIRFDRELAKRQGANNVQFYWGHGGNMTAFEDGSFDIVHEGYVLHEQPAVEARKIVDEMMRVLKPGGRMTIVDVIYDPTEEEREFRVQRAKGPEPFLAEYMKLNVGQYMQDIGLQGVESMFDPSWDGMVWTATKPA